MRFVVLAGLLMGLLVAPTVMAQSAVVAAPAGDGPGAASHFDLARKDCIGTARNTTSRVWFTLAGGVLSDVYYPTIDNTNVETMQYIVTDGATFTDLQSRDMTYSVTSTDPRSLSCEITTMARSGKYRIVSQYVSDPDEQTLLIRVRFVPLVGRLSDFRLYVRLDPTINGNGGGGTANGGGDDGSIARAGEGDVPVACDLRTTSNALNRDYAQPVCSALAADSPFLQVSNGFVGQPSDGLVQLDSPSRTLTPTSSATNGNVVQTVRIDLEGQNGDTAALSAQASIDNGNASANDDRADGSRPGAFSLALGFGKQAQDAVSATQRSLRRSFGETQREYADGWHEYDEGLVAPPTHFSGVANDAWRRLVDQYFLSLNVVKASEDKTFPGALVASIASPWGQAVAANDPNTTFFGSYREVFARDVYEAWSGLLVAGDKRTARDVVNFLFDHQQQADGSFPRNSLLNGKLAPDSFNTQLDECSYPILMAWQLGMNDATLYQSHIKPAANFVISHGPSFGPERWEEQGGFSPSTIAAEVAGLVAAADLADHNHDAVSAAIWRGVADEWQRKVESWTVTTNGPLSNLPYFIRLSKTGDPNAAISYGIGNGGPTLDQRTVIDAGFLELVRLGLKPANDPAVIVSLPVVDATIKTTTSTGDGWHRYNGDGYGDGAADGHPWAPSGKGTGHLWPLLSEERGEYNLAIQNRSAAVSLLESIKGGSSGVGLVPEQVWEVADLAPSPFGTDPTIASIGFRNGHPAGSAAPLTWAAGTYARLLDDIVANRVIERPSNTVDRYINHQQGQTLLTVTAPADASSVTGGQVEVTGSTAAGNSISIAATNIDTSFQTTTVTAQPDTTGAFSTSVTVGAGTTVLTVVATSPHGATAVATRTVVFDFTAGTVVLDVTDPSGDDHGPGNYAYPTAADFHPGAFDIQEFVVIDDGTTVTFKLKVRDLSPTFGSSLGAQLVDVYVHAPGVAPTSVAASFPTRNYQIATAGAWNRLIEVQGFGNTKYVDAQGTTLGSVKITANAVSRFITFSVPAASLGHPASGWGFSVVLTGQDGFSPDQARAFTPTPGAFSFGVCAGPSNDPHCTFDPTKVPKAMDVLAPTGVSQSNELDYTLHPVVIQPVTVP